MISKSAPTVAVIGMFDGVHLGHRLLIDTVTAKARSEHKQSIAVTFINHPLSVICPEHCPKSLMTVEERIDALYKAGIDRVIALDFDEELRHLTARQFICKLNQEYGTDSVVIGFNQHFGSDRLTATEDYVKAAEGTGVTVMRAPQYISEEYNITVCSSAIRKAISEGDITKANALLGHEYSISGIVVEGQQIGRTIGFPTANIQPLDANRLIPANGVYAVSAEVNGSMHRGVMNIGKRPTVDDSANPKTTLEVFFLDFNEDIYKDIVFIKFAYRIRDERKFANLTELREQINKDIKNID
jgi:riboflavin kinase/FMN adenylyltransferase